MIGYIITYLCLANIVKWKKQGDSSVWLHIPIELSHLISKAASLGFIFHHARHCHSVLTLWLDSNRPSKIPLYGTHQVGVAGEVVQVMQLYVHLLYNAHDGIQVLCIEKKQMRFSCYKTNTITRLIKFNTKYININYSSFKVEQTTTFLLIQAMFSFYVSSIPIVTHLQSFL